jgi:hypothetical protein
MPDSENLPEQPFKAFRRDEDFEKLYANNVQFQPSEWDLKAIFGEVDFDDKGQPFVEQHTSIAMPWIQAKLLLYFLTLQVDAYELTHGKIRVPASVLPPDPEPPSPETIPANPLAMSLNEIIKKRRIAFLQSME